MIHYNAKTMKSRYYLVLVLSLVLTGTVSNAQSLEGIQDMVADQPATLALTSGQSAAQDAASDEYSDEDVLIDESGSIDPAGYDFFDSEEPLEMTLSFDIRSMVKSKSKPEYFDAMLTVKESDTDSITQDIKVKSRGFFRCSFCSFPPIMMKFKNNDDETIQVYGKKLKLVTHCHQTPKFQQYLLKEYLAYKLYYNLAGDYSFKTRLVRIRYQDVNKPKNSYTSYGILIENEAMLAKRNNGVFIKSNLFTPKDLNPTDMNRVALFNYMIGNTDWSVQMQHNLKILMSFDNPLRKGIPILYDFDYSGLVNTYYAAPFQELPIKNVTERYYQGVCMTDERMKPIIEEFAGLREKMLGTISDFPYLEKNEKKSVESYISSFYSLYKNQNYMISMLNNTCRSY